MSCCTACRTNVKANRAIAHKTKSPAVVCYLNYMYHPAAMAVPYMNALCYMYTEAPHPTFAQAYLVVSPDQAEALQARHSDAFTWIRCGCMYGFLLDQDRSVWTRV